MFSSIDVPHHPADVPLLDAWQQVWKTICNRDLLHHEALSDVNAKIIELFRGDPIKFGLERGQQAFNLSLYWLRKQHWQYIRLYQARSRYESLERLQEINPMLDFPEPIPDLPSAPIIRAFWDNMEQIAVWADGLSSKRQPTTVHQMVVDMLRYGAYQDATITFYDPNQRRTGYSMFDPARMYAIAEKSRPFLDEQKIGYVSGYAQSSAPFRGKRDRKGYLPHPQSNHKGDIAFWNQLETITGEHRYFVWAVIAESGLKELNIRWDTLAALVLTWDQEWDLHEKSRSVLLEKHPRVNKYQRALEPVLEELRYVYEHKRVNPFKISILCPKETEYPI